MKMFWIRKSYYSADRYQSTNITYRYIYMRACIHTHSFFFLIFAIFSLECKESEVQVSERMIRLTKCFLEETENEEMSPWFASCFAQKKNKYIFTSGFPVKKKKQNQNPKPKPNNQNRTHRISSWGHELTSAHSSMLVIPTWFLLFNSLSLLNLGKINSVGLYQAARAPGK